MSEEVGIILREAVPGDAKDILLMMGQVNKETEFLVLDEAELLLPPETLEEELDYIYESNNNLLLLAIYEGTIIGTASVKRRILLLRHKILAVQRNMESAWSALQKRYLSFQCSDKQWIRYHAPQRLCISHIRNNF